MLISSPSRAILAKTRRAILKIGSKSLTGDAWDRLAQDVAAYRGHRSGRGGGRSVVIVSSGAIAHGIQKLGLKSRPKDIAWLQAAARFIAGGRRENRNYPRSRVTRQGWATVALCNRAQAETLAGVPEAASAALAEAESIAAEIGAGPDSELGIALARVRNLRGTARAGDPAVR